MVPTYQLLPNNNQIPDYGLDELNGQSPQASPLNNGEELTRRQDQVLKFLEAIKSGISGIKEGVVYYSGVLTSKFFTVLVDHDASGFRNLLIKSLAIMVLMSLIVSFLIFIESYLALQIRNKLTINLHGIYLSSPAFYQIHLHQLLDNPDQRIADDVKKFSDACSHILYKWLVIPFSIAYYSYKLYKHTGYIGPVSIYVYFLASCLVTKFLMPFVARAVYAAERNEGNFRSHHINISNNYESVAMSQGESHQAFQLNQDFKKLIKAQLTVAKTEFFTKLNYDFFALTGSIFSYLIISVPIFSSTYDKLKEGELSTIISLTSFISMMLIYQFNKLIEQTTLLADLMGYTNRVYNIIEIYNIVNENEPSMEVDYSAFNSSTELLSIKFDNITLNSPTGLKLLCDFSLSINQSQPILITGPNGSGKSSITRLLSGVWAPSKGSIKWPQISPEAKLLSFVSPSPFLISGSIKDQIVYPDSLQHCDLSDELVHQLLNKVKLSGILAKVGCVNTFHNFNQWHHILSTGQLQKLMIARVFYHKPLFAVLDEGLAFVDEQSEVAILKELSANNITVILVTQQVKYLSDDPTQPLALFHHHLRVPGDGAIPILSNHQG